VASPERAVIDAELTSTVRRVVRALPAKFREPLLLSASGDATLGEIAEMLGLPVGTVKWRVSEARRLLRDRLRRIGVHHA
jgi:RNA polymerase sigma-70 factor (ECF subfamily)